MKVVTAVYKGFFLVHCEYANWNKRRILSNILSSNSIALLRQCSNVSYLLCFSSNSLFSIPLDQIDYWASRAAALITYVVPCVCSWLPNVEIMVIWWGRNNVRMIDRTNFRWTLYWNLVCTASGWRTCRSGFVYDITRTLKICSLSTFSLLLNAILYNST